MARWRIAVIVALACPVILLAATSVAWAVDTRGDDARVARGVELAGTGVGGLTQSELEKKVLAIQEQVPAMKIRIASEGSVLTTTAADLGVTVDRSATVAAVMRAGHDDPGILKPIRWAKALVSTRQVPVRLEIDRAKATAAIRALEGDAYTRPIEPSIKGTADGVTLEKGTPGSGIDIDRTLAALPGDITTLGSPITLTTRRLTTQPSISDAAVQPLVDRANAVTANPVTLVAGEKKIEIAGADLRGGFKLTLSGDSPVLALDPTFVQGVIDKVAAPPFNPTGVTYDLVNGVMTPKPGADAVLCCGAEAAQQIVDGLLAGTTTIPVGTRTITAADGVAIAGQLGVKEVVGEFTTRHPAGQPRVTNIHRIADITRGALIAPGQTFSVNDYVGRRTKEKGFVVAPVIEQGEFSEDVGGGVSQYATTLFNAAFFAGLDIPQHKAHSIYISRYPFGREATLAYPSVDLKITNNTPYGVVIWPTYTASSITVQLWSTRYATGEQTAQSPRSGCGKITTTRTRTFVDGHTDSQKYLASYDCNPPAH